MLVELIVNYLGVTEAQDAGFELIGETEPGLFTMRAECENVDDDREEIWAQVRGEPLAFHAQWVGNHRYQRLFTFDPADVPESESFDDDEPGEFVEPELEPEQARNLAAALKGTENDQQ